LERGCVVYGMEVSGFEYASFSHYLYHIDFYRFISGEIEMAIKMEEKFCDYETFIFK